MGTMLGVGLSPCLVPCNGVGDSGPVTLLEDTFTGANGTAASLILRLWSRTPY